MSRGSIPTNQDRDGCLLFGETFSAWLLALPSLGLRAVHQFLTSGQDLALATSLVDNDCKTEVLSNGKWSLPTHTTATWALCDGRPSKHCLQVCADLGIQRILSLKPLRSTLGKRHSSSWHTTHLDVQHSRVGGITARTDSIYFSWLDIAPIGPLPSADDLGTFVLRDASTILVSTAHQRGWCKAPRVGSVWPLHCLQHTTYRNQPVYHGRGLLPSDLGPTTFVATPSVYKDASETWAVRHLQPKELLEAFGLPHAAVAALITHGFAHWGRLFPVESMVAAFSAYNALLYFDDDGGVVLSL